MKNHASPHQKNRNVQDNPASFTIFFDTQIVLLFLFAVAFIVLLCSDFLDNISIWTYFLNSSECEPSR